MKKQWMKWAAVAAMMPACIGFVACSDSSSEGENGGGNSGGTVTTEESKQKMEATAKELMTYVKASDFQELSDLARYISETYDDYNDDAVENWYKGCLDDITTQLTSTSSGDWTYKNYRRVYRASAFTGHLEAANGKWNYTAASDLQFIVKDKSGQRCVLKLVASVKTVRIHVDDESHSDYYYDGYNYVGVRDTYNNYVEVPENIEVTATQGSKQLAYVKVTTSLTMSGEDPNPASDQYSVTISAELNNGYKVNVSRAIYKGGGEAALDLTVKKDATTLLTANVSGKSRLAKEDGEYVLQSGSVDNLKVDVLGKVQVKGTCKDLKGLKDNIEDADDNDDDESAFKRCVGNINALVDLGLYFDNTSSKQATLSLEPFAKERYYYGETTLKWYYRPIIAFTDGTSYGVEEYFDEDNFGDVVKQFEQLIEDFEDMFK